MAPPSITSIRNLGKAGKLWLKTFNNGKALKLIDRGILPKLTPKITEGWLQSNNGKWSADTYIGTDKGQQPKYLLGTTFNKVPLHSQLLLKFAHELGKSTKYHPEIFKAGAQSESKPSALSAYAMMSIPPDKNIKNNAGSGAIMTASGKTDSKGSNADDLWSITVGDEKIVFKLSYTEPYAGIPIFETLSELLSKLEETFEKDPTRDLYFEKGTKNLAANAAPYFNEDGSMVQVVTLQKNIKTPTKDDPQKITVKTRGIKYIFDENGKPTNVEMFVKKALWPSTQSLLEETFFEEILSTEPLITFSVEEPYDPSPALILFTPKPILHHIKNLKALYHHIKITDKTLTKLTIEAILVWLNQPFENKSKYLEKFSSPVKSDGLNNYDWLLFPHITMYVFKRAVLETPFIE